MLRFFRKGGLVDCTISRVVKEKESFPISLCQYIPLSFPIKKKKDSSKIKGPLVSARRKARSWPPSLKVSPFASRSKLDESVAAEANLAIFRGSSVFNQGVSSCGPEISKDFTVETEGDEGLSHCSLQNKVCLPLSASFEKGHSLAGVFVPNSLSVSSVSFFHSFCC